MSSMKNVDASTPAVVFRSEQHASLGTVRSLGRMGVKVFCIDHDPNAIAMKSRYCAGQFYWDFDSSSADESIKFLISVAEKIGKKAILFPTGDERNLLIDQHRDLLSQLFLLPRPKPGAMGKLYNKQSLYELCKITNIPTAATAFPDSIKQAMSDGQKLGFPLLIKGIDPDRLEARTGRRLAYVREKSEFEDLYTELYEPGISNLALQEYIPWDHNAAWIISAYVDNSGNCKFAIPGRKLRQLPMKGGLATYAITEACDVVVNSLIKIAGSVGYHGMLDADFIYDKRDGNWKLLDVNPRHGANFRLFVDKHGYDVVRVQYLDLTGQKQQVVEPVWGRRFLVEDIDLETVRDYLSNGMFTFRSWLKSLIGISELGYLALDDPKPSTIFIMKLVKKYTRRIFKRILQSFKNADKKPA